jgi:hypothetical protein
LPVAFRGKASTTTKRLGRLNEASSAPTRATSPLLIVRSARRHISKRDRGQTPDVDADLHRGRDGKQVDL